MRRFLVTLALAACVGRSSGTFELAFGPQCADRCPDDDATGHCPPTCTCCACCSPVAEAQPRASELAPPPTSVHGSPACDESSPLDGEPGDILHVPKALLA